MMYCESHVYNISKTKEQYEVFDIAPYNVFHIRLIYHTLTFGKKKYYPP